MKRDVMCFSYTTIADLGKSIGSIAFFSLLAGLGLFLGDWQLKRAEFKKKLILNQETISSDLFELEENIPFVCVQQADLKKAYYAVIREKASKSYYFLELGFGHLEQDDLEDIRLGKEQDLHTWPMPSNPFLPSIILEQFNPRIWAVSQLSALKEEPTFALVSKNKLFLSTQASYGLEPLIHKISCPPERHRAYAVQWFLLAMIALFFALRDVYFFRRNQKRHAI